MTRILVTGATGMLGQQVVKTLINDSSITVRCMRHHAPTTSFSQVAGQKILASLRHTYRAHNPTYSFSTTQWVQADLVSGEGLNDAVRDIDVIVHCTDSTNRLLEAACAAKVSHMVAISIVGCDRIPLSLYRQKVAGEEAIRTSGLGFSILRATQFHPLIDLVLRLSSRFPWIMPLLADWHFQSIDESEVGRRLAELALESPTETVQEIGGPQVLSLGEMASTWMALRQMRRTVLPLPLPGKVAAGYRRGDNTCGTEGVHGEITWAQWVQRMYQREKDCEI